MSPIGEQLRQAREARGWSLEEVARRTRIGVEHLSAIEEGRDDELPEGPWRTSWIRALCEELEVDEPILYVEVPEPAVPLHIVRLIGITTLFAVIGLYSWHRWGSNLQPTTEPTAPRERDQHVEVQARRNVRVAVWVDGEAVHDGVMKGGDRQAFDAFDHVAVEVGAVDAVKLRYNGRAIVPQGRQDAPRRLEFIDDQGF